MQRKISESLLRSLVCWSIFFAILVGARDN